MNDKPKLKIAREVFLQAGGVLTMSEALSYGIHRRTLYALRDRGDLEVMGRGLYRLVDMPDPILPDFIPVAKKIPKGVICLISALAFHEIGTQIPHFVYVALPSHSHAPSIIYPPMRFFWYGEKLLTTGVEVRTIDGRLYKVFNVEKTLIDCVKFRNKIGMDVLLEALKMSWRSKKVDLTLLFEYAKVFRVEKVLRPIMETIVNE